MKYSFFVLIYAVLAIGCTRTPIAPTTLPERPTVVFTPDATPIMSNEPNDKPLYATLRCDAIEAPDGTAVCFPVVVARETAEFNEDGSATGVVFDMSNVLMVQLPTESGRCYLRGARRWVACENLVAGNIVNGDFVPAGELENSN